MPSNSRITERAKAEKSFPESARERRRTILKAERSRGPESPAGNVQLVAFRKQQDTLEGREHRRGRKHRTHTSTLAGRTCSSKKKKQKKRKTENRRNSGSTRSQGAGWPTTGIEAVACFKLEYQNNLSAQWNSMGPKKCGEGPRGSCEKKLRRQQKENVPTRGGKGKIRTRAEALRVKGAASVEGRTASECCRRNHAGVDLEKSLKTLENLLKIWTFFKYN